MAKRKGTKEFNLFSVLEWISDNYGPEVALECHKRFKRSGCQSGSTEIDLRGIAHVLSQSSLKLANNH